MLQFKHLLFGLLALATVAIANVSRQETAAQPQPKLPTAPGEAQQSAVQEVARFSDFSEWVTSLAFSPDGKTLAAGSYEVVKLFDPVEKQLEETLPVDSGFVKALAFSPDGRWLAAGDYRSVLLWDAESRERKGLLEGHRGYVTGLAFSPDGKLLATASDDETVRLWDIGEGKTVRVIEGHTYPVQAVAFSPNGKLLATASGDETRVTRPGEVRLWDVATGEEKKSLPEHQKTATDVAFSPDGRFLVSSSVDETVNVYDVESGEALGYFGEHGRPTNSVLFAPDGHTVISGAGGRAKGRNEVKLWNREDGEEWATIEGHAERVTSIALAPDGTTLATAGYDKAVALWDIGPILTQAAGAVEQTEEPADNLQAAVAENAETKNAADAKRQDEKPLRAGMIGLDTSHVIAFTKILNDEDAEPDVAGCRVVAAFPEGSPDIESSVSRVPGYTKQMQEMGVEIVDSIEALLEKVDVVFLETNDGRPHLEQILPCLRAGKPVFVDKPVAGSLADGVAIYEAARQYDVPVFSSSSLRFAEGAQALRNGKIGDILGCDAYSPASLEETHPDLFWYGIHGVETLFTVMGPGCQTVSRTHTPDFDVVVGTWEDGRIGTFRGIREGRRGMGGTAFGTKGIEPIGPSSGYRPMLVEILKFFRTGEPPVDERETLEIYAFMEAADESKRQGGAPVTLEGVLKKARAEAEDRLKELSE